MLARPCGALSLVPLGQPTQPTPQGCPLSAIGLGQAVILGVVEGVTEFLPVSSTGHLKIAEGLMKIPVDNASVVGFTAVVQVGAIAAVLVYFFRDIVRFA